MRSNKRNNKKGGSSAVSNSSKRKRSSILNLRTILAILAIIAVGSTLYYDSNVSSSYQRAMDTYSASIDDRGNISGEESQSQQPELTSQQKTAIQKYEQQQQDSSNSQKWTIEERNSMRQYFRNDIQESTSASKINKTTILFWDRDFENIYQFLKKRSDKQGKYKFYNMFPTDEKTNRQDVITDSKNLSEAWGSMNNDNNDDASSASQQRQQRPRIIHTMNLCHAYKQSKVYAKHNTPHVLLTHMNENWGALSTEIINRTGNWGNLLENWDNDDCHWSLNLKDYINSPTTLAIFTTQHQSLYNHPKIYSIPIGIASDKSRVQRLLHHKKILSEKFELEQKNTTNSTMRSLESHDSRRQRRRRRLQQYNERRELTGGSVITNKKKKKKTKEKTKGNNDKDQNDPSQSKETPVVEREQQQQQVQVPRALDRLDILRQTQTQTQNQNQQNVQDRSQLLMINSNPTPTRKPQMDAVIQNFARHEGYKKLRNNYGQYEGDSEIEYLKEISNSKFILCPSGLGWDTYRIWEALNLGTIPVIERYRYKYELITYPMKLNKLPLLQPLTTNSENKKENEESKKKMFQHIKEYNATYEIIDYEDGWHNSFKGLPIVWIDGQFSDYYDYDNNNDNDGNNNKSATTNRYLTPQLLENEYDKFSVLAIKNQFQYKKLTSTYWINLIESFLLLDDDEDEDKWFRPYLLKRPGKNNLKINN
ncbi:hypothetical protein FRACYDRAFT_235628 [Fragilariopsis cylindrus CCMP1102]|uniref:RXYLT1 C-terminal domain-containing protein n=1 Tax=Fragilariopsis cylindrus CCMP1102 TaxID=635003 RepID=A0A1E7FN33_9STRA|nr:hypothetical protein FRACYDRAFT_235628 [Fragilariopsis cylindrus CCMP1102]|eukprot:OEU19570.1 hypothetical protein FRACYDRAFT_235628 [Fragilariopsis cylindrus CCMP1102]